ncbi:hypothetical protein IC006_2479 [Sulfuracidifex tepidarius]|uniref:Peptidase M48 domain-containing protein n=1 Tax=Sulfuracidifex tepidarius TaxID=1294262 RepID=A0A510DY42_9CREN|nr:hypothetical protein IC006_2479 [Sulfuracidifex tepidarius]BBG27931.1 hypothetical protein IC007_2486 [Sulfuracidifex tepidarius]
MFIGLGQSDGSDESDPVVRIVKAHELGHAKEHHPLFIELAGIAMLSVFGPSAWFIGYGYDTHVVSISTALIFKVVLVLLSMLISTLLFSRVAESRANAFTFRTVGEGAYDALVDEIRRVYGRKDVQSAEEAPFISKFTHTSSREAMKTGDPLSSLGRWESPWHSLSWHLQSQ